MSATANTGLSIDDLVEKIFKVWIIFIWLNLIDMLFWLYGLRQPHIVELNPLANATGAFGTLAIKMLAPCIVLPLLILHALFYRNEKMIKAMMALCVLYGVVAAWNLLQFILD